MLVFLVFVIGISYVFSYSLESPIILYVAVIVSVFMAFSSYWYSDKIVAKLAGAHKVKFEDNKELYRILENLCIAAGLPMPKLYLIDESQPNAFATGRNPEHAIIAITAGLLEKLDRSELEGVLAHELSHVGNRDMLLMTVTVVLAGFIALISDMFIRIRFFGGGKRRNSSGNGQMQMIMMGIALASTILAPIAATLIRMAVSRKREFLADATGALITRYPEGLALALEKISSDPSPMKSAKNATAHLYIANPFRGKQRKNWLTKMFMTHPPIEERVAKLRGMKI